MKRPIGRPLKQNAITREGQLFTFWLDKKQWNYLDDLSTKTGVPKAEMLRRLIKSEMDERKE